MCVCVYYTHTHTYIYILRDSHATCELFIFNYAYDAQQFWKCGLKLDRKKSLAFVYFYNVPEISVILYSFNTISIWKFRSCYFSWVCIKCYHLCLHWDTSAHFSLVILGHFVAISFSAFFQLHFKWIYLCLFYHSWNFFKLSCCVSPSVIP